MAKEAVVSASAAIPAVMIVLIRDMDLSGVGQREDRPAIIQPREVEFDMM